MATPAHHLTAADELLTHGSSDARVELVRGEEREMGPTGRRHGVLPPHVAGLPTDVVADLCVPVAVLFQ